MAKYDELTKRLGRLRPYDFVIWLFPNLHNILDVSFEDREFELTERRVDILYKAKTEDIGDFLLHLEFQVELNPKFSTRMHEYSTRICKEHGLPVKTVVVFLDNTSSIEKLEPVDRWELAGEIISEFHYTKIILPQKKWKTILDKKIPALWPLIPLTHIPKGEEQQALNETAQCIENFASKELKGELAAIFYMIGGYRYPKVVKKVIGGKLMQDLMQSKTYREAVEVGKTEGKIEGKIEELLKVLSWTSLELSEKYEVEVKSVRTIKEFERIEERIKKNIEERNKI